MAREIFNTPLQNEFFSIVGEEYKFDSRMLVNLFCRHKDGKVKFYTSDIIKIGPEHSKFAKKDSYTTIGRFIFNKLCIEHLEVFGYINSTMKGGMFKKIDENMATALLEDEITNEQVFKYIDRCQYLFGGTLAHVINPSLSLTILKLPNATKAYKEKLIKENMAQLKKGDPITSAKLERLICDHAMAEMRKANDPAMDIFDSECGVDFYNNFKTMFVMKGAVRDNTEKGSEKYNIILSDYDNGVQMEDHAAFADSLVRGSYSKAILTAVSGYAAKKYNAMYQTVRLAERGSDCKTKKTKRVLITEENKKEIGKYHYIMEKGKPVLLTPKTVSKYVGKEVDLRTPLHCEHKDPEYCNICYGELPYLIGVRNVGLTFNLVSNAQLNNNMKKFHDITIKLYRINIDTDLLQYYKE